MNLMFLNTGAKVFLGCWVCSRNCGINSYTYSILSGPSVLGGLQSVLSAECWACAWGEGMTVLLNSEETSGSRETSNLLCLSVLIVQ